MGSTLKREMFSLSIHNKYNMLLSVPQIFFKKEGKLLIYLLSYGLQCSSQKNKKDDFD